MKMNCSNARLHFKLFLIFIYWIVLSPYLFLNLHAQIAFNHVDERVLAAGVEHPLPDATTVPRHGIYEDCNGKAQNTINYSDLQTFFVSRFPKLKCPPPSEDVWCWRPPEENICVK